MLTEETSPISYPLSPISYPLSPISYPLSPISSLDRPRATQLRAGVLVGPTAVGKSDVAQWIAEHLGVPVLSADSMLVYRGMDIGTAKPSPQERGDVPYFGIDCVDPGQPFSTGAWLSYVFRQLAEHEGGKWEEGTGKREEGTGNGERKTSPISYPLSPISYLASDAPQLVVAGGTGLYVKALLYGLDAPPSNPEARARWTALFESGGLSALRAAVDANPAARALLPESDLANPRRLIRALERAEAGDLCRPKLRRPSPPEVAAAAPPEVAAAAPPEVAAAAPPEASPRQRPNLAAPAAQPCRASGATSRGPAAPNLAPAGGSVVAGLTMPRDRLAARIMVRIEKMFKNGLVEEAISVREASGGLSSTACGAIGYAEALAVADGKMTREEATERIAARTRQLAKRQFTWFRHQLNVEWVEVGETDTPATLGPKVLEIWKHNGLIEI